MQAEKSEEGKMEFIATRWEGRCEYDEKKKDVNFANLFPSLDAIHHPTV